MTTYYMLTDEHDNQHCDGLDERNYARVAQAMANRVGRPVYAWASDSDEPEEFLPEEPTP